MASIVSKRQGNKTYYYLVESARVGGKPRIVSQRYLGPADEIVARLSESGPGEPERSRHLAFGDLAGVWSVLERLKVAEIVDDVVGSRRADAGASVGTYVALAAANRVVDPCSKRAFADWWATTAGDRMVKLPTAVLDHRRFWDAMDAISTPQLAEIERRIVARMVEVFEVDLSGLVLDMTNFATYIDSANERAPIAQRGHAKQKRRNLRLVGLGLIVSTDGGIPLVSHAYAGDRPDVTQFPHLVEELVTRFAALAGDGAGVGDLTLVFDAGQNSQDNVELFEDSPLHFVGSLPPSDHPDLLAVPKARYRPLAKTRFPGLTAFETRKVVFGVKRRLVVTHSQNLHDKQSRGFDQTLAKARRQLTELSARLARGRTRKPRDKVEAEIDAILKPRWLSRVISTTLTGDTPAELRLTWRTKPKARAGLEAELFGKRILFTDKTGPARADIVADYRSQSHVEADFRQMKDPHVVSFSPMFHWTDDKIRTHVFYCVLALTVARLMVREADRHGLHMSVRELLDTLAGIQETVLLYPSTGGRPRARRMLTETSPHPATPLPAVRPRHLRPDPMTTAIPSTTWARLEAALRQRRPVRVSYHGRQRLICPHALGWNNGRPLVLGYQTGGHTTTGTLDPDPRRRWRCLFIDEVDDIDAADPAHPWGTADNYNPSRPFHTIDDVAIAITATEPRTPLR